jgi:hypothetical protein
MENKSWWDMVWQAKLAIVTAEGYYTRLDLLTDRAVRMVDQHRLEIRAHEDVQLGDDPNDTHD